MQDIRLLKDTLMKSWGGSTVLGLTFDDYLLAETSETGWKSDVIRKSAAPLRNMNKDFDCIKRECTKFNKSGKCFDCLGQYCFSHTELCYCCAAFHSYPAVNAAYSAIDRACSSTSSSSSLMTASKSVDYPTNRDAAFVTLLENITGRRD